MELSYQWACSFVQNAGTSSAPAAAPSAAPGAGLTTGPSVADVKAGVGPPGSATITSGTFLAPNSGNGTVSVTGLLPANHYTVSCCSSPTSCSIYAFTPMHW